MVRPGGVGVCQLGLARFRQALCRGLGRFHLFLASPPGLGEDCAKTAAATESLDADTLNSHKIFWTIVLSGGSRASPSIQSIGEHPEYRRTSKAVPDIQIIREHRRPSRLSANIRASASTQSRSKPLTDPRQVNKTVERVARASAPMAPPRHSAMAVISGRASCQCSERSSMHLL